ncbi:MAG: MBL fold metallo-hydrolase [Firmicutes bacterium]|nr:MBL fold metallo-hydrolase [Dethiobacter sp.]MBS3888445.1 MBL fold metallo-hydrolase [Bacillota bacterium]
MQVTIHRGTHEIGGTFVELRSGKNRLLLDAGYPLSLGGRPLPDQLALYSDEKVLESGMLPRIKGLYRWDEPAFDAVIISHAHIDHYGLLHYVNFAIPVYLSRGTRKLIEVSALFRAERYCAAKAYEFDMYKPFQIGGFRIMPFLMDHSAFDAAAFEISSKEKTILYTGDFRGHGRKGHCLERFISKAKKCADALLIEGTLLGRQDDMVITEQEIEALLVKKMDKLIGPLLFQTSSQNIDRIVSFYRAASRLGRIFVVDLYTANVLYALKLLGDNQVPYPSEDYPNIKVFYPYRLTLMTYNKIGKEYAKRFSPYHISRTKLNREQNNIVMAVRPSMRIDIERSGLKDGLFVYSLWTGYRSSAYQQGFEEYLTRAGFSSEILHTSGHATVSDIRRVIAGLEPKQIIPIHTMSPDSFVGLSDRISLKEDGVSFDI